VQRPPAVEPDRATAPQRTQRRSAAAGQQQAQRAPAQAPSPRQEQAAAPAPSAPLTPPRSTQIGIVRITENIAMIMGQGGNIGVSIGEDGVFLVDDQYAPVTPRIRAMLDSIDQRAVRLIINTHWHGDHTGGNENFAKGGTVIIAHENVRRRLSVDQFIAELGDTVKAAPKAALPIVTFPDRIWLHLNGDNIQAIHVRNAHTDGDVIVRWAEQNVIHTGDVYSNGTYPFIDLSSGGSLDGMIEAVDTILAYSNDYTRIIPGHGPLSNARELRAYREMLVAVRDRLRKGIAARKSAQQLIADGTTKEWDGSLGSGFMKPDRFLTIAYESVQRSIAAEPRAAPAKRAPARRRRAPGG
jgi:glyoxylase-like metal-dependent hydrolase (beta-lactamase superfamily II)